MHRPPVDPHADIPRGAKRGKKGFGSLPHPDLHRGQEQQPRAGGMLKEPLDCLINTLRADSHPALGAVHGAEAGRQHPEKVIHLRQRADGGAGGAAGGALLDRHRRREPLDPFKEWLGHLPHKLPGIGAETFHIAALPLGIERVEGERGFATAAGAAAHSHRAAGDVGIDAL